MRREAEASHYISRRSGAVGIRLPIHEIASGLAPLAKTFHSSSRGPTCWAVAIPGGLGLERQIAALRSQRQSSRHCEAREC